MRQRGFTLTELLIVVAIIILIALILFINLRTQIDKAHDATRKTDLTKIQRAFEEYYNDNGCYPDPGVLDNCGGTGFAPYLRTIPCDPVTKDPYVYAPGDPVCSGYRACAKLQNTADPDIARIGCDPIEGCGWMTGYNFCVSSGLTAAAPGIGGSSGASGAGGGATATPTPTTTGAPTATPIPGHYACSPGGSCNSYSDPQGAGCPVTYQYPGCLYQGVFQCTDPANRCTQY